MEIDERVVARGVLIADLADWVPSAELNEGWRQLVRMSSM